MANWWIEMGFPSFESGKDGFPRPGQVVQHYRRLRLREKDNKPWTQKDLADWLKISGQEVYNIEKHDSGFTIERRRCLARLFTIPPILLGIITPEEMVHRVAAYLPFGYEADGFPSPGQVVKYYRYLKLKEDRQPWSQNDVAHVLGICVQEVGNMENRDRGFTMERRRFLSKLFAIPPALLGVVTLEEIEQQVGTHKRSVGVVNGPSKLRVDLEEYQERLGQYRDTNHFQTAQGAIPDIAVRIVLLQNGLPVLKGKERTDGWVLLSDYHQLLGLLLRDMQDFEAALSHLDQAVDLVEDIPHGEVYRAIALDRRGTVLLDRGKELKDRDTLEAARLDFQRALALSSQLPETVLSSMLLRGGHAHAAVARDGKEGSAALALMDRAGNIARTGDKGDPYRLRIDVERYHIDKAAALIALNQPNDAIAELLLVPDNPAVQRRNAYKDVLLAQAYLGKRDFEYAAVLAGSALPVLRAIHSRLNVARVAEMLAQLKGSPAKDCPDVARLEWLFVC